MDLKPRSNDPIALHVILVGFHHKKGMQVEYAYPPFESNGEDFELPTAWRHLPSLCLPDGAHNHEADTVYFHLPHLTDPDQTVFGVSCYRQIDADKVANRTADITRNTVQKSVCVLTTLPIYGYVQERLQVTTRVFFKGADFSDVQDLEGLYHDLNNTNWRDKLMHGICVSDVVRIFGRNVLVLFKLLLLERRMLFYHSPVGHLVKSITSLLALLPGNLPDGLNLAAATSNVADPIEETVETENGTEATEVDNSSNNGTKDYETITDKNNQVMDQNVGKIINIATDERLQMCDAMDIAYDVSERRSSNSSLTSVTSRGSIMSPPDPIGTHSGSGAQSPSNLTAKMVSFKGKLSGALSYWTTKEKSPSDKDKPSSTTTPNPSPSEAGEEIPTSPLGSEMGHGDKVPNDDQISLSSASAMNSQSLEMLPTPSEKYAALEPSECGLPLKLFTKGNIVHPYLSLQYLEVLGAPTTRAFVVGASNALFIHKKSVYDVFIQLGSEEGKIEVNDPELRKQLSLSMEDLRFAENILRQVEAVSATMSKTVNGSCNSLAGCQPDVFLDGVGWVGGEEWLRYQFKVYLLSLLRSSTCSETSREYEVYNSNFMHAWKNTLNYKTWSSEGPYPELEQLPPGHPHAGNLSMSDMRIRLSHTILGVERSRKINQTLAHTGTAVVKTKEAVGGAITSAKGALTNLWSSFTTSNGTATSPSAENTTIETPATEIAEEEEKVNEEVDTIEEAKEASDQEPTTPSTIKEKEEM